MRRILVSRAKIGQTDLASAQAHHLRDVLRLGVGDEVEVFDAAGNRAAARIISATAGGVSVEIIEMLPAGCATVRLTIAAAIPKGARADWMIEKLSELGVDVFIPLATARAVVLPRGAEKQQRWVRLATESARQSGRAGVMKIERLTDFQIVLKQSEPNKVAYLSLEDSAQPISEFLESAGPAMTLLIGPEGGWADDELAKFRAAKTSAVALTQTTLRVETAAIAAAAMVLLSPVSAPRERIGVRADEPMPSPQPSPGVPGEGED
jgi:16S rRNA (uracil1498-N3)-methyltransferase